MRLATVENAIMDAIEDIRQQYPDSQSKDMIEGMQCALKDVRKLILYGKLVEMDSVDLMQIFEKKMKINMLGSNLNRYNLGVLTVIQVVQEISFHSFALKMNAIEQ